MGACSLTDLLTPLCGTYMEEVVLWSDLNHLRLLACVIPTKVQFSLWFQLTIFWISLTTHRHSEVLLSFWYHMSS